MSCQIVQIELRNFVPDCTNRAQKFRARLYKGSSEMSCQIVQRELRNNEARLYKGSSEISCHCILYLKESIKSYDCSTVSSKGKFVSLYLYAMLKTMHKNKNKGQKSGNRLDMAPC